MKYFQIKQPPKIQTIHNHIPHFLSEKPAICKITVIDHLNRHFPPINSILYSLQHKLNLKFMNQKGFPSYLSYLSHRSITPKLKNNSPNASNNAHNSYQKPEKNHSKFNKTDNDSTNSIHQENSLLKEENRMLKRQLNYYRAQNVLHSSSREGKKQVNDLRQTIKKEAGEIKDLKTRLQMLSKQCKMYEDIIDKMENKINRLNEQNNSLQEQLILKERSKRNEKMVHEEKVEIGVEGLNERVNEMVGRFEEMEREFEKESWEWEKWKEHWSKQKGYYLHRILDLQRMMGISDGAGNFSKEKRY